MRKLIGADLQNSAWITQLVNFIEDDDRAVAIPKKHFRLGDHLLHNGQVAVEVQDAIFSQTFYQCGFPDTTHPGKPDNRRRPPCLFNTLYPERSFNHVIVLSKQSVNMSSIVMHSLKEYSVRIKYPIQRGWEWRTEIARPGSFAISGQAMFPFSRRTFRRMAFTSPAAAGHPGRKDVIGDRFTLD